MNTNTLDNAVEQPTDRLPTDQPTPDLSDYLAVHEAMRASNRMLAAAIADIELGDKRRIVALRRWFTGYVGELRNHHSNEDTIFFPALARRVPAYAEHAAVLADDHRQLHQLLERLEAVLLVWSERPSNEVARDRALLLALTLRDELEPHLDLEDAEILPLFERHFTVDEYAVLNERMLDDLEFKQAMFTVPWFMSTVSADVRAAKLADAPLPLKAIYYATRATYRRQTRRALGVTEPARHTP